MRRAHASSRGYAFCPARPERSLWRWDGLGAPDSHAGQIRLLGHAIGSGKTSGDPQKAMGDGTGDALSSKAMRAAVLNKKF
jgi:hypothetical protein